MKKIEENKLYDIEGGIDISGNLINAFVDGIKTIMDVGRSFGSAIRRIVSGNLCEL